MKRIFNGKVTVKNFIVAMLSALIIFESVGSMSQIAFANGDENSEQTAQQTEQASEAAETPSNEEKSEAATAETHVTETPALEGAQVLGAKRVRAEGAVLGARRANTSDDTNSAERCAIIILSVFGMACLLSIKKEAKDV